MGDVHSRDAQTLKNLLKSRNLRNEQEHEAWNILHAEGIDAALAFIEDANGLIKLKPEPVPYTVWGEEHIDAESRQQMDNAARLPIAVKGALMPDAHVGYGLPIGGVLATEDAVIPYAVGVDIACRMRLSVYDASVDMLDAEKDALSEILMQQTRFGAGASFEKGNYSQHPVMDDPTWEETELLRSLKDTAYEQLGSSGGGNHFVEWGIFELADSDEQLGITKPGRYLALLSHSGSRGPGYQIANHYSKLAREMQPDLPDDVKHLAWFAMDSDAGREYWMSMQLAGRYASANHACIHDRIARAVRLPVIATVENHHNFAWKETVDGRETIVHRKGATPAGENVLGIIPGSMGDSGYIVRGKGNVDAINSAAHGAGRKMSRRQAKREIRKGQQLQYLRERRITMLAGGLDEAPQAYKNIEEVMLAQDDLVTVVGKFHPRIVRMAND